MDELIVTDEEIKAAVYQVMSAIAPDLEVEDGCVSAEEVAYFMGTYGTLYTSRDFKAALKLQEGAICDRIEALYPEGFWI